MNKIFQDKELQCIECRKPFTWTVRDQIFFEDRGLQHEPKRCRPCRETRRGGRHGQREGRRAGRHGQGPRRQYRQFTAECTGCGGEAVVPFEPKEGRPVYCDACFQRRDRSERGSR